MKAGAGGLTAQQQVGRMRNDQGLHCTTILPGGHHDRWISDNVLPVPVVKRLGIDPVSPLDTNSSRRDGEMHSEQVRV
jgi:hypothetical protein